MFSAIGRSTARQLQLAVAYRIPRAPIRVPRVVFPVFQRAFAEARGRPRGSTESSEKPKKTAKPKDKASGPKAKKRVPTEKQKEREAERKAKEKAKEKAAKLKLKKTAASEKQKLELQELRRIALVHEEPPRYAVTNPFSIYVGEDTVRKDSWKEKAVRYHALPETDKERLAQQLKEVRATTAANYKAFVQSKTPAEIYEANRSRKKLMKLGLAKKRLRLIPDPRLPTPPANPYLQYFTKRIESGAFTGMSNGQASIAASAEWKGLSEADRLPYNELYQLDKQRYITECRALGISVMEQEAA